MYDQCNEEIDDCGAVRVLIIYDDYDGPWNYGPLYANMVANIIGHWGAQYNFIEGGDYLDGDIENYDYGIYVGTVYANALSPDFLQDVVDKVRPVFWMNYNLFEITWDPLYAGYDWGFEVPSIVVESDYLKVLYKGKTFDRHELYKEYNVATITDPARAEVKAWLQSNSGAGEDVPYIIAGDGLWYCADNALTWLTDANRYVVFADLLGEFLGMPAIQEKMAMLRFEDVSPVETDIKTFRSLAQQLADLNVKFSVGVIPVFIDPTGEYYGEPVEIRLTDDPELVDFLHELEDDFDAELILHGYTHQYDGVTGDDWEFWEEVGNTPIPGDSVEWVQGRLDAALAECNAAGIYPTVWETPHYSASQLDYNVFYDNYDFGYERTRVYNNFDSNPELVIVRDVKKRTKWTPEISSATRQYKLMPVDWMRKREFLSGGTVRVSDTKTDDPGDENVYILQYMHTFSYKSIYGNAWIPENMDYLDPSWSLPGNLLDKSDKYSVLAEPISSFFFHHFYPKEMLFETVTGLINQGYNFVSIDELLNFYQVQRKK